MSSSYKEYASKEYVEQTHTWESLLDRPFYEASELVLNCSFDFKVDKTSAGNLFKYYIDGAFPFDSDSLRDMLNAENVGNIVCVKFDGVPYECEVKYHNQNWYIGNAGLAKDFNLNESLDADSSLKSMYDTGLLIDTGEPFFIVYHSYYSVYGYIVAKDSENHSVEIGSIEEVVHTIDPKYLPEGISGAKGIVLRTNNGVALSCDMSYEEVEEAVLNGSVAQCVQKNGGSNTYSVYAAINTSITKDVSVKFTFRNMEADVVFYIKYTKDGTIEFVKE
jgi:hypothetical protein